MPDQTNCHLALLIQFLHLFLTNRSKSQGVDRGSRSEPSGTRLVAAIRVLEDHGAAVACWLRHLHHADGYVLYWPTVSGLSRFMS